MAVPSFLIKNGGTDFMNRQKSIFDVLSDVEKETSLSRSSSMELMEIDTTETRSNKRKRTKRFRGKESMFKVPMDPPPRFQRPGQNPKRGKKWIKYSLADVSDHDLSNEANTAAALSFLKSLRDRKAEKMEEEVDSNAKHLFKAPSSADEEKKNVSEENTNSGKSVFVSSKLIMPEYVVGQKKKVKKVIQRNVKSEKAKEVYLDHIHVHEDE